MTEFNHTIILEETEPSLLIKATAGECTALAQRFNLDVVHFLEGSFFLFHIDEKDCFCLKGSISSKVGVDGKDISIDEPIELFIVDTPEKVNDFSIVEDVEIASDGKIDVGEIMAQYLYLNAV